MSADSSKRAPIAITLGDPTGVGPEVLVKAFEEAGVSAWNEDFLIIGHEQPLHQAAGAAGARLRYARIASPDSLAREKPAHVSLLEPPGIPFPEHLAPGRPDTQSGALSFKYLELGAALALEGKASALVTLPVSKAMVARTIQTFRGHTEYLQERSGAKIVRMMLATREFRITLVTTHCPLREVASLITSDTVRDTIQITHDTLKARLDRPPAIVVCSLNPHAGDSGLIGFEEGETITPAILEASARGCRCAGPYPADVALAMAADGRYDAAIAMYHDQALIALKLTHPNAGANVTLGLPFTRTSPLHGTGFDIAGKGIAAEDSFVDALHAAILGT